MFNFLTDKTLLSRSSRFYLVDMQPALNQLRVVLESSIKGRSRFLSVALLAFMFILSFKTTILAEDFEDQEPFDLDAGETVSLSSAAAAIWQGRTIPGSGTHVSSGAATLDDLVEETMRKHRHVGMGVAVSMDGRVVYSGSFGFRNWAKKDPMQHMTRVRIGSTTKVFTTLSMLKLLNSRNNLNVNSLVYGPDGILSNKNFTDAYQRGTRAHFPVVGIAIGSGNHVTAWLSNGTFTVGTSDDLASREGPRPFTIPSNQNMQDIIAIARGGPNNNVYAWYANGSFSIGTRSDLSAIRYHDKTVTGSKFKIRRSGRFGMIVGIAADTERNRFYAFYNDGTFSIGSSPGDLQNIESRMPFSIASDENSRYDIIDVAYSGNENTTVYFSDGTFSKGQLNNLEKFVQRETFERVGVNTGNLQSRGSWNDAYEATKIIHLLSHTSGMAWSGDNASAAIMFDRKYNNNTDPMPYRLLHRYMLISHRQAFVPGSDTIYSNHGMGLTGFLIERISGKDWWEYLRQHVLKPAGLHGVGGIFANGMEFNPFRDAASHSVSSSGVQTEVLETTNHPGSAAGALSASADQLIRLLLSMDRLPNYSDVASPALLDRMESRPFPTTAANRAHGWQIVCQGDCSAKKLWHNGKGKNGSYIATYRDFEFDNVVLDQVSVAITTTSKSTDGLGGLANVLAKEVVLRGNPEEADLFALGIQ